MVITDDNNERFHDIFIHFFIKFSQERSSQINTCKAFHNSQYEGFLLLMIFAQQKSVNNLKYNVYNNRLLTLRTSLTPAQTIVNNNYAQTDERQLIQYPRANQTG